MEKIRNLSLRKTIFVYMAVALFCSFVLSAVVVRFASRMQIKIWWNYVDEEAYFRAVEMEGSDYVADIPRPGAYEMTTSDHLASELCDFLQTYTILLLSMAGSCAAVFLFYRNKLKRPIEELVFASQKIAEDHLDFHIAYENKDEMGMLCMEFEKMREQLARNNQILWKSLEEEKVLRAAIAHDIRSPLSVLKGYQEMLTDDLSNADVPMEQVREMLSESRRQIERMDAFVETMRKMNSLESREPAAGEISAGQLEADLRAELRILEKEYGKRSALQVQAFGERFCGDREIILEVTENLLSNAFRYGRHQVEIMVRVGYSQLSISVRDDGEGFQEEEEKIVKPFHQQNLKDSLKHAGIGMYISRLYCEKHGGRLVLENEEQGGAAVTAIFRRIT